MLIELQDIIDALVSSSTSQSGYTLPQSIATEDGQLLFSNGFLRVHLMPAVHMNEIELVLEIGDKKYSQDTVQSWLGEPVRAYMFSMGTIQSVAKAIVGVVGRIFERLKDGVVTAVRELEIASDRLSEESMRAWTLEQANDAWHSRRYNEAVKFYTKLGPNLSKSEEKRLKIAKDRSGSK